MEKGSSEPFQGLSGGPVVWVWGRGLIRVERWLVRILVRLCVSPCSCPVWGCLRMVGVGGWSWF